MLTGRRIGPVSWRRIWWHTKGGWAKGDYAQTLDLTDVATGWVELAAVLNKAQVWVFEAFEDIRQQLPFPLLGMEVYRADDFKFLELNTRKGVDAHVVHLDELVGSGGFRPVAPAWEWVCWKRRRRLTFKRP